MKILAVIPARYNSQRFPGKPLVMIGDRPMIQWVYEAVKNCNQFYKVIVATDNLKIAETVEGFGGDAVITSEKHATGTDRVAEAALRFGEADVIANIQGDQPFVQLEMLERLISPYLNGENPDMTTVACPLDMERGYENPNVVKVLCDRNNEALYFTRAAVPYYRNKSTAPVYQHLGLYAFTREFLLKYSSLSPTPLEVCEGLEQLRVLENGYQIKVCIVKNNMIEINTPDDLASAEKLHGFNVFKE